MTVFTMNQLKQLTDTIVQYILYADELVLCSDTAEGLQEQIDGMYEFCKKWHTIVSLMKTKVSYIQ